MLEVKIESAVAEDLPLFVEMEQEAGTSEFIIPYSLKLHQDTFSRPEVIYLRILSDGEVAGFLILSPDADGSSVEFRRIVVSEKGRGIGQIAIRQMELFCRDHLRSRRIWLDVFEHNLRGRHIYEKMGYSRFGESEYKGKPLLLYEKPL